MSFTWTNNWEASSNIPEIDAIELEGKFNPLPWATWRGDFKDLREVNLDIHFIVNDKTIPLFTSLDYVTQDRINRDTIEWTNISRVTIKQWTVFNRWPWEYTSKYTSEDKLSILVNILWESNARTIQDNITDIIVSDRFIQAQIR